MTPVTLWRTVAIIATLGWAATVLGWVASSAAPSPEPADRVAQRAPVAGPPERMPLPRDRASSASRAEAPSSPPNPDLNELREAVRSEVWHEVEQERAERRQRRSERHLGRLLERAAEFADTHGLGASTLAQLETSAIRMHEQLEALRPDGPPGPDGPPEEALRAIEDAFDQFRDDVALALDDPELADAYTEQMTPRPLRGRPPE